MTVRVRVIPRAKKDKIVRFEEGLKVYISSPAIEGRANKKLIEILAAYFKIKKYKIKIIKGRKQREKLVQWS